MKSHQARYTQVEEAKREVGLPYIELLVCGGELNIALKKNIGVAKYARTKSKDERLGVMSHAGENALLLYRRKPVITTKGFAVNTLTMGNAKILQMGVDYGRI